MHIDFHIAYTAALGEQLVLNRVVPSPDGARVAAYRMATTDGRTWHHTLAVDDKEAPEAIDYFYSVDRDGREQRHEWLALAHRVELTATKARRYKAYDRWIDIPADTYLYSSAFTECLSRRRLSRLKASQYVRTLRLRVRAPQLRSGQRLALVGDTEAAGAWQVDKAVPMRECRTGEWTCDLDADTADHGTLTFKFVAISDWADDAAARQGRHAPGVPEAVMWETGPNRTVCLPGPTDGEAVCYELEQAFFALCDRRVAGTLVPVFSLRSHGGFGVGDFGDLAALCDWAALTGQRVVQVLPVNDTTRSYTWRDSYPYSCNSIFALHPQYADLRQLPALKDAEAAARLEALRQELNQLPQIDYERMMPAKIEYLQLLFAQEGREVLATPEYKEWFRQEQEWLVPYARYSMLRDETGTTDFRQWRGHEAWDERERRALTSPRTKLYAKAAFYYYVQYQLARQLQAAHRHARAKGVVLKGDIPIGVSRDGCDVWMEPRYFNMDGQAGAPPDDFSVNGQNWGFPTYNWPAMLADGCLWWVRRFQNMQKYFDAYRIDHVLGFFRIWEIPITSVHGLAGQFAPALAMTPEEIEGYGLKWQEQLYTEPFIADWVVDRLFGPRAKKVREKYLQHLHHDISRLRPDYDTQRKIQAAFAHADDPADEALRDGLYALADNVLFLRDKHEPNKFHPRIAAQNALVFETLHQHDKQAFNRLYDDYFYRRNNQFWYREAMKKLPRLTEATRMLVCAEDLGMVPECVAWVMDELRILSLEVPSMPKQAGVRFGQVERYPYRAVTTISSHDMPTLRQWWDEDLNRTQAYYNGTLHRSGAAPHPLPAWLARDILGASLASPAMLCILAIQDWLATDERLRLPNADAERINVPANPDNNWHYRMHIALDDLMHETGFNTGVKELVEQAGRN